MARLETETQRYVTWLPFLIDSARRTRQGWQIREKERIAPKSRILAPLSLVFPVLRVTYERAVAGGMLTPDDYRLASWMASHDPSSLTDPRYAAFFASTLHRPGPPDTPLAPGSSPAKVDPPMGGPVLPPPVPTDVGVQETQQEGAAESSSLPPPPPKTTTRRHPEVPGVPGQ